MEILTEGYAARVDSILAYRNITRDLLQQFVYPIVPNGRTIDDDDENLDLNKSEDVEMKENDDEQYDSDSTKFSDSSDDSCDSLGDEYSG